MEMRMRFEQIGIMGAKAALPLMLFGILVCWLLFANGANSSSAIGIMQHDISESYQRQYSRQIALINRAELDSMPADEAVRRINRGYFYTCDEARDICAIYPDIEGCIRYCGNRGEHA